MKRRVAPALMLTVMMAAAGHSGPAAAAPPVTGVSLEAAIPALTPDMKLVSVAAVWQGGLDAMLASRAPGEVMHLTVGVFPSEEAAADAAAAHLENVEIRLQSGSISGTPVGDAAWHAPNAVVFRRENVVVKVFGSDPSRAEKVAEALDAALAGGADYVTRGATVERPVIEGLEVASPSIARGARTAIRLAASGAPGRRLFYGLFPEGGEILGGDPPAPYEFVGEEPGRHAPGFQVVDDRCVLSGIARAEITVSGTR